VTNGSFFRLFSSLSLRWLPTAARRMQRVSAGSSDGTNSYASVRPSADSPSAGRFGTGS